MGYTTTFSFDTIHNPWSTYEEIACSMFDEIDYVISNGSGKWYDHDDDMKKLSKLYPDEVFILRGEGEEGADIWRNAYKNGVLYKGQTQIILSSIKIPGYTVKEHIHTTS